MEYELIKSKRKTISLIIKMSENATENKARFIVRAPFNASKKKIEGIIQEKQNWIEKKLQQVAAQATLVTPPDFSLNSTVLFLGKEYYLDFANTKSAEIIQNRFVLPLKAQTNPRAAAEKFYRKTARTVLAARLDYFAGIMGEQYRDLRISGARTRWGSCSRNGGISLSWRLILCHEYAIDYVIVHELCHIKIKNHKKEFYSRLASVLPDYKSAVKYLKDNNGIMHKY